MPIQPIDANTAKAWFENSEAIIIDVREPSEHGAQAIPGATLLPLRKVCTSELPKCSGKKIILHCKTGRRGTNACEKLLAEDPNLELYHLEGGIDAWQQAGYDVQASNRFFMALDRQVQLTIGVVVFIGVVLGYFVHPFFLILSAFFGLGLVNAGLTGWCGLALLMARMPWNQRN